MKNKSIMMAVMAAMMLTGCATINAILSDDAAMAELDAMAQKWAEKAKELPEVITPEPDKPTDKESLTVDAIPFSSLQWTCGGFSGSGAKLDVPRISNLSVKSNGMSIKWDVDLRSWGLSHDEWRGALACLFCKVDGQWKGGKFDWISSSRSTRDFANIRDGYNGWSQSDFDRAEAYAFVVVSENGKRRSNVITQGK